MNELFNINTDNDRITVSARDLHEFLELEERFSKWFDRMASYGFENGVDYTPYKKVHPQNKQEITDYQLTIEMAKEIAMLQRSERGKQARQYFIQLEKDWNSPQKVMARALQMSQREINSLRIENAELKPKALFADVVSASEDSILIGQLAKMMCQNGYEIGQNRLFETLRKDGFLCTRGENYNMPTQKSVKSGLMEIKERTINDPDGKVRIARTTKVTGKGQVYFVKRYVNNENTL